MQVAGTGGCENSFLWSLESPPAENCLHHELRFASDALKRDPEVVLTAVRRNALSLESPDSILLYTAFGHVIRLTRRSRNDRAHHRFAAEELRSDRQVVLAAVRLCVNGH